jgi:very-short-patch-repair endonuclease/predicted nucleic acid-binding Zn ribbon protein
MRGECDLVICQICDQEMSFGRIKRHISTKHKETTVDQYVKEYWSTLPLHQPCKVCEENIVYKYKTCSKECRTKLEHEHKGKSKPEGFMSTEHKEKIGAANTGKTGGFTGHTHTEEFKIKKSSTMKGNQNMLNKKQSDYQKQRVSEGMINYYKEGNEPWTKNNPHTPETIEKIFQKQPMNKLEQFVASILDENNIKYKHQFFIKIKDGICKSYDFKIKDTNILIEIDGDYWHGGPGVEKHFHNIEETKQNDLLKNQIALENGYLLLRFWESDIYNKPEILVETLLKH